VSHTRARARDRRGFVRQSFSATRRQRCERSANDSANESLRAARLALCALTLRVLTTGLDLLGVPVPEQM
jgi:arginyl-tRNA synthetase